jgi:hypothetical protein
MIMSIENHPNVHAVKLMLLIKKALDESLRGLGTGISVEQRLEIAYKITEEIEEIVDALCLPIG